MAPRKKGSHYEVVLEDRHLLVVFFVAVGLSALFFTLGFLLGRNQAVEKAAAEPARELAPATQEEQPKPSDLSFYDRVEEKKPTAAREAKPKPTPKAAQAPPTAGSQARPASTTSKAGIYLQVAALTQEPDAKRLAGELRKLGFVVVIRPPSRDRFYRVLVGPLENAELADAAEGRLKAHGFREVIRR